SLCQRENLKQFIQSSKTARENHQRLGQIREPELSHEKVMELEVQRRRDVRIWVLFERQPDIQANGFRTRLLRTAVSRLHNSRSATSRNHKAPPPSRNLRGPRAQQKRHSPGIFIIACRLNSGLRPPALDIFGGASHGLE